MVCCNHGFTIIWAIIGMFYSWYESVILGVKSVKYGKNGQFMVSGVLNNGAIIGVFLHYCQFVVF